MKTLFDFNDIILYINNFDDSFFIKSFSPEKIEKAKEIVLQNALIDSEYFKNLTINKTQFENICKSYKDKLRTEIFNL